MENIKIHIGTSSDVGGIDRATAALRRADAAADDFIQSIKMGVGIDIGGKSVNSIGAIPGIFQQAISRGVEFNVTMQNAEVGIANVLAKFMHLDAIGAKAEAARAMAKIIELEPKAAGGLEDLVGGFLATVAASQSAGVSVEQNIDLVGRFANAVSNANLPVNQLAQEMRAILTGNITPDAALANILQIDNADIEKAKEAGHLYQFLIDKLGSLGDAGDSAGVRISSFESAVNKALGELSKPIFDAWIDGITELTDASGPGAEGIRNIGYEIAELVKAGVSFTKLLTEHSDLLLLVAKSVGALVAAYAAYKIATIVQGLSLKARAILANKTAIDAETAALAANSAAQRTNVSSRAGGAGRSNIAGAAGLGVGLGLIGYELLQGKAAEINARTDRSRELGDKVSGVAARYGAMIKNAASVAEKEVIIKGLGEDIAKLKEAAANASEEDSEMLVRSIGLLEKMRAAAAQISDEKLKHAEAAKAAAEGEKKASSASKENAEKDAKIIADAEARRHDRARDRTASDWLADAKDRMAAGDIDGAKKSLSEQESYFRDWLAATKEKQAGASRDDLKANLALQEELAGYLEKIEDARKELPEAIAEADAEAKKKRIAALEDERDLVEAQGNERLAQADEDAAKRKQIEDEIAAKRLDLENQIGALQEESATKREAREAQYRAGVIQRENELKIAKDDATAGTKAGDLFSGTRRRRGFVTSDSFEQGIDVSRGPQALTDFGRETAPRLGGPSPGAFGGAGTFHGGLVPPSALPPPAATPGAPGQPGAEGAAGGTSGIKEAAGGVDKLAAEIPQLVEAMKQLGETSKDFSKVPKEAASLSGAVQAAASAILSSLSTIKGQLQALQRNASK